MKILQIHNFYRIPGGECNVVRAEKKLLEERGHKVPQFIRHSSEIDNYSLKRRVFSFLQIPFNIQIGHELAVSIKKHRPDVAHVHNVFPLISPSIYYILKKHNVPVVQTIHNYRFICPNGMLFSQKKVCCDCLNYGLFSAVKKKCMHNSITTSIIYSLAIGLAWKFGSLTSNIDRYIAPSRFIAKKLSQGRVPDDKIIVRSYFADHIAKRYAQKKKYILYLGRLSSEKGLWTLMKALKKENGISLKIAGTGPIENDLKRYVKENSDLKVEFTGFVKGSKKAKLIREALYTVTPSEWYDNFPVSVIESLALGTPVVASRMGGLPEQVEHRRNGLLFTAGNIQELAECLRIILTNPQLADKMARVALDDARERFSPHRHFEKLVTVYEQVLASKPHKDRA